MQVKSNIFQKILNLVQRDINNRGIKHILPENNIQNFENCIKNLYNSQKILIFTGFQCNVDYDFKAENDGIAGSLIVARQLARLGKQVKILIDNNYLKEFTNVFKYYIQDSTNNIEIHGYNQKSLEKKELEELQELKDSHDTFFSIERPSFTKNNKYYTMGGIDLSEITAPIDRLFFYEIGQNKVENDKKIRICVGDGGNEIGMGNVYEKVVKYVKNGEKIAANSVCDDLLVCDVSNWGAFALVEGMSIYDFQQKDINISYEQYSLQNGINLQEEIDLYKEVANQGFRDGIVKKLDGTLDGQPLEKTIEIIQEIKNQYNHGK